MYEYQATLARLVDGDTVELVVDQGLDEHRGPVSFRLWGIDAAEKETAMGIAAKQHLADLLAVQPLLLIRTLQDRTEKYGRYLVLIHDPSKPDFTTPSRGLDPSPAEWALTVNARMIGEQYALAYTGKGARPTHSTSWPDTGGASTVAQAHGG